MAARLAFMGRLSARTGSKLYLNVIPGRETLHSARLHFKKLALVNESQKIKYKEIKQATNRIRWLWTLEPGVASK